jgi:hypothetical protein
MRKDKEEKRKEDASMGSAMNHMAKQPNVRINRAGVLSSSIQVVDKSDADSAPVQ